MIKRTLQLKIFIACLALLTILPPVPARGKVFRDKQIKAAFIYSLANFVTCPGDAAGDNDKPLIITVLGDDKIADYLEKLARGEYIRGRKLMVKQTARINHLDAGQIIFIGSSMKKDFPKIFNTLKDRAVLTVGDTGDFTRLGGMVGLIRKNRRIRIEINLEAVERTGIMINSKLLKLAEIVGTED